MYLPSNSHKAVLKNAERIIRDSLKPTAIFAFSHDKQKRRSFNALFPEEIIDKKLHFYLLVFTDEIPTNAIADVSDMINTNPNRQITVTLLLHSVESYRKATGNQLYFFWKITTGCKPLFYYNGKVLVKSYQEMPARDLDASATYWNDRHAVAVSLLEAARITDVTMVKFGLLRMAVEQVCLGMIEVFLGYRPNHFALGYLFDICRLFTSLTDDNFPRNTVEDSEVFDRLDGHLSKLRYGRVKLTNPFFTLVLERRCHNFIKKAAMLVEDKLTEVKIKNAVS